MTNININNDKKNIYLWFQFIEFYLEKIVNIINNFNFNIKIYLIILLIEYGRVSIVEKYNKLWEKSIINLVPLLGDVWNRVKWREEATIWQITNRFDRIDKNRVLGSCFNLR
jgi:hypothetical protein